MSYQVPSSIYCISECIFLWGFEVDLYRKYCCGLFISNDDLYILILVILLHIYILHTHIYIF